MKQHWGTMTDTSKVSVPSNRHYTIIHGHFYQPPRENPWLDSIERQQSAAPITTGMSAFMMNAIVPMLFHVCLIRRE